MQDFIAQARKTQDLWSASYLLSYLVAQAMLAVADVIGPDSIIYPQLRGAPLADWHWWKSGVLGSQEKQKLRAYHGNELLTPNLPNRFLALVPAGEAGHKLAQAAEEAVRKSWQAIATSVRGFIAKQMDGHPAHPTARFTLDLPPFATQTFTANFRICPNPCCPCGVVGFECRRVDTPEPPLRFDLDVFDRQLNTKVQSAPDGVALGQAFLAEAQEAQWTWLADLFMATKRRQMETMDLDTLNAQLPADVIAGDGTMVGYAEIFPWAEAFKFNRDGAEWFVDDQHCVRLGCDCTEAGLAFFRVPAEPSPPAEPRGSGRQAAPTSGGERQSRPTSAATVQTGNTLTHSHNPPAEPLRCITFLHYDYVRRKFTVLETPPGKHAPDELLQALREANPDLEKALRHRHAQLKQLGRRLLPKTRGRSRRPFPYLVAEGPDADELLPPAPTPAAQPARRGRNDPCPCGSGKKFKKCCGTG